MVVLGSNGGYEFYVKLISEMNVDFEYYFFILLLGCRGVLMEVFIFNFVIGML